MPMRKANRCLMGRGADEKTCLEVLRGVARFGRGDADHAADGDGQCAEGRRGPAVDQEDGRGGHQGGDGHAGDGVGGAADEADDARADGDEEKSEDDHEQRGAEVGQQAHLRAGHRLELEEEKHEDDERDGADDGNAHGQVVFRAEGLRRPQRSLCRACS